MITVYIPTAELLCPHFPAPCFSKHKHKRCPKPLGTHSDWKTGEPKVCPAHPVQALLPRVRLGTQELKKSKNKTKQGVTLQTTISCFGEQAPERKSLVSSLKKQNHEIHSGSFVPTIPLRTPAGVVRRRPSGCLEMTKSLSSAKRSPQGKADGAHPTRGSLPTRHYLLSCQDSNQPNQGTRGERLSQSSSKGTSYLPTLAPKHTHIVKL